MSNACYAANEKFKITTAVMNQFMTASSSGHEVVRDRPEKSFVQLADSSNTFEPTLIVKTKQLNDKIEIRINDNNNGIR